MRCSSKINLHHFSILWILLLVSFSHFSSAQENKKFIPKKVRILFVLDGSGSMLDTWEETNRWETSKSLLLNMIDSLNQANPSIEIGIRVFGHQSPRTAKDCQDSKLEIPFGSHTAANVKAKLNTLTPQGWTPITYSLTKAAGDFTQEPGVQNAIVLITDGLETCGGDVCGVAKLLAEKKIAVRPFIIGLGMAPTDKKHFDCLGEYYDASSPQRFEQVLKLVVSQALNNTTTQILLLDADGKPHETNVPVTLYDSYTGLILYNFVHRLDAKGLPDTLWLDPAGKYNLQVHTYPPVEVADIQLKPGIHNTVKVPAPQGILKLEDNSATHPISSVQCLVLDHQTQKTLNVQLVNTEQKYLAGTYDIEVLTLPRIIKNNVVIKGNETLKLDVPLAGTLQIVSGRNGIAGVFMQQGDQLIQVYDFGKLEPKQSLYLQPGKYIFITRWDDKKASEHTEEMKFEITSGMTTTLRF